MKVLNRMRKDEPTNHPSEQPPLEPLTPEEMERFLAQARVQGRLLTSEERARIFGPQEKARPTEVSVQQIVPEQSTVLLDAVQLEQLQNDFFPELGSSVHAPTPRLVQGVIFDFDETLAVLSRPIDELMEEGARAADAYLRSTGMELPAEFWPNIIEARRFAQEKSEQENEEHLADDALSFLLQFFGYPASKMDPDVLKRAVDIFYAPEMTAWRLAPGAIEVLRTFQAEGYKVALLANYNCDRVFQRTVDYLGLRPYLDMCISSASVEYRKPDEKFFHLVLERWDALPYEIIVVGDSLLHDIKGGIDLGALTVHCTYASTPQVTYDNAQVADQIIPDAVIDALSRLPAIVQAWANPV